MKMGSEINNEMWNWNEDDYNLQNDTNLDIPPSIWEGVIEKEDEFSYMFDESTPVRPCGDAFYHETDDEHVNKDTRLCREASSQGKRRRMLQFDDETLKNHLCDNEMSSVFLKSKDRGDTLEDAMSDMSQWVSGFAGDTSVSGFESLDPSSEGWLADCFNDTEMHYSPDETNLSGGSDVQIDTSGSCCKQLKFEATVTPERRPQRAHPTVVFKGTKTYMKTPTKVASTVVLPFDFIKPCAAQGDVTLKDINRRMQTPPPSKKEDDLTLYPTSAFSGKPVVGKTKIRIEGGKGSITIMRTKG